MLLPRPCPPSSFRLTRWPAWCHCADHLSSRTRTLLAHAATITQHRQLHLHAATPQSAHDLPRNSSASSPHEWCLFSSSRGPAPLPLPLVSPSSRPRSRNHEQPQHAAAGHRPAHHRRPPALCPALSPAAPAAQDPPRLAAVYPSRGARVPRPPVLHPVPPAEARDLRGRSDAVLAAVRNAKLSQRPDQGPVCPERQTEARRHDYRPTAATAAHARQLGQPQQPHEPHESKSDEYDGFTRAPRHAPGRPAAIQPSFPKPSATKANASFTRAHVTITTSHGCGRCWPSPEHSAAQHAT